MAFCARPLVRRIYQALVVALAAFLVTLVGLKQPFRGYLAEVRLVGPATEGLDLESAALWLRQADNQIAAIANPPRGGLKRGQLRVTHLAERAPLAVDRVDSLAQRWLYLYLPDRLQNYRQSVLADLRKAAAVERQREDAIHQLLEQLRQKQISEVRGQITLVAAAMKASSASPAMSVAAAIGLDSQQQRLLELRRELGTIVEQFTDDHPQVRILRMQIASLEQQMTASAIPILPSVGPGLDQHFVSITASNAEDTDLLGDVTKALAELACATAARQDAESHLAERMHELTSRASGVFWTKTTPTVGRLGGTPRWSTMLGAALLAAVAGTLVFRATGSEGCATAIQSASELASALELPVIANLSGIREQPRKRGWRLLTPPRLRAVVGGGEAVLVIAVAACLLSIAIEPSLARQVLADPFGALSEVLGRFGV